MFLLTLALGCELPEYSNLVSALFIYLSILRILGLSCKGG